MGSPLLIGLIFGAGCFLIYWSFWPLSPQRTALSRDGFLTRLDDDIKQAGYRGLTPTGVLLACVLAFALVFALLATRGVATVALCFAAIAGFAPISIVRARARSRRTELRQVWPDAVDNVTSAVRAGMALPEALSQLAIRGPEELRPAFAEFAEDYRATGRFHECLDLLKERLADPVGDRLVESLRIAREVGGSDLGKLLRTLSTFLREDAHTRAELETRQSWTVNAARLASAAPWLLLLMLSFRRESIGAYGTAAGAFVLVIGLVATVVAYRLMIRLGRLPEDRRVLR